ncbi:hypothetical protein VTK56DRAFT_7651 [Thermocarpiscus australiensis]
MITWCNDPRLAALCNLGSSLLLLPSRSYKHVLIRTCRRLICEYLLPARLLAQRFSVREPHDACPVAAREPAVWRKHTTASANLREYPWPSSSRSPDRRPVKVAACGASEWTESEELGLLARAHSGWSSPERLSSRRPKVTVEGTCQGRVSPSSPEATYRLQCR